MAEQQLCAFDKLFTKSVPGVLEKIFFYLDTRLVIQYSRADFRAVFCLIELEMELLQLRWPKKCPNIGSRSWILFQWHLGVVFGSIVGPSLGLIKSY